MAGHVSVSTGGNMRPACSTAESKRARASAKLNSTIFGRNPAGIAMAWTRALICSMSSSKGYASSRNGMPIRSRPAMIEKCPRGPRTSITIVSSVFTGLRSDTAFTGRSRAISASHAGSTSALGFTTRWMRLFSSSSPSISAHTRSSASVSGSATSIIEFARSLTLTFGSSPDSAISEIMAAE